MFRMLFSRIEAFKQDNFFRSLGFLIGGAAIAQLASLLALPILTRLYSPEHFSVLAIYGAFLTIFSPIVCMRLDAAIPLSKGDEEVNNLLALALISATLVTVLFGLIFLFFIDFLSGVFGQSNTLIYGLMVLIGLVLMGLYTCFQYLAVRQKAFKRIAHVKASQTLVGLVAQIWIGLFTNGPLGLVLGQALMSGVGAICLAIYGLKYSMSELSLKVIDQRRLLSALSAYRDFPKYSVFGELTNNVGSQLPVLLIAGFLVGPEAGLLFLAMKSVGVPTAIVGNAVAQIYYSAAAEYARLGTLADETVIVFKRLSRIVVVPLMMIAPYAPDLFSAIFGAEWGRAGVIVIMILPWCAFKLIASPISMVMNVCMRQRLMLILTLFGLAIRLLPLFLVLIVAPDKATLAFATASALYYAAILIVFLFVAGLSLAAVLRLVASEATLWCSAFSLVFVVKHTIEYV